MLKCKICYLILSENDLIDDCCPECKTKPVLMCSEDKICQCSQDITETLLYCPKCKEPVCPCGSHDCEQISRVTGYLGAVSGWSAGKSQELKDRTRYDPFTGDIVSGIS